jgi:hypothetical protein
MAFKMKGMSYGKGTGSAFEQTEKHPDWRPDESFSKYKARKADDDDDKILSVPGGGGATINTDTGEVIKPKLRMTKTVGKISKIKKGTSPSEVTDAVKSKPKAMKHSPRFHGLSDERIKEIKAKEKNQKPKQKTYKKEIKEKAPPLVDKQKIPGNKKLTQDI